MAKALQKNPIHLGLQASAVAQPEFTGMDWYADYTARHAADGREGRLVSMHRFTESWDVWEMHPHGSEVVLCVNGLLTLVQDRDGEMTRTTLQAGEYAINEPGVWHTADVEQEVTAVFITAGIGTEHRSR